MPWTIASSQSAFAKKVRHVIKCYKLKKRMEIRLKITGMKT